MKRAKRNVVSFHHSHLNVPTLSVSPGETFEVETELASGAWLQSIDDVWRPGIGAGRPNPTVVVEVQSAEPGQCLAVHIVNIEPEGLGYTALLPENTPLRGLAPTGAWPLRSKTVRIRDGYVEWSESLRLRTEPMIGTLGTAPETEVFSNAWPGPHGGNMDAQEVRAGATVYLPVWVPGALLHVGDVHALQGDGEINCAGGIECRSLVTLRVDVVPRPVGMAWPRIVDGSHLTAVGCARPAEDAFRLAAMELIGWLSAAYGLDEADAHLLLGQVLEARCTQLVDPLYTYVAKIDRDHLPAEPPPMPLAPERGSAG